MLALLIYREFEMKDWKLFDFRLEIQQESDTPVTMILSAEQLRHLLEATREDFPGLFILRGPSNEELKIGLGDNVGYLFWINHRTGAVAYAKNDEPIFGNEYEIFVTEGIVDEIPSDQVLPFNVVVDAAVFYYFECALSNRLTWKMWDPNKKAWSESRPTST